MSVPSVRIARLVQRGVRNLVTTELQFCPRLNIISGDNGQGKTSLIEAVYLAATTRSFRTAKLADVRQHDAEELLVRADFIEMRGDGGSLTRVQQVVLRGARTAVSVDGNRPQALAEYATRTPVVVFHPDELTLSTGPAAGRRRLLDRVALYARPSDARLVAEYGRAIRSRQELLRRPSASDDELAAYEDICATTAAGLTTNRRNAAARIAVELASAFERISTAELELAAEFKPGGSDDPEKNRAELRARRRRDAHMKASSYGPHRDDLALSLRGHAARLVASQGQHRAITLALKAAESAVIRSVVGVEPIHLLDDVSSELDPTRMQALFRFLAANAAQILLTTTNAALVLGALGPGLETAHFHVENGLVERL